MSFDHPHAPVGDDAGRPTPDGLTPSQAHALSRSAPLAPRNRTAEPESPPDDLAEEPTVAAPRDRRRA